MSETDPAETETGDPAFWTWSLRVYDRPGVAETLLALQDEFDLNVNLVLWALWAGQAYPGLNEKQVRELVKGTEEWHRCVTVRLRKVRRDIKNERTGLPKKGTRNFRREVKDLELASEKIEQQFLAERTIEMAAGAAANGSTDYLSMYVALSDKLDPGSEAGVKGQADRLQGLMSTARQLVLSGETDTADD